MCKWTVLPELARWADRRGWRFPPPLNSGRHLSSARHTQWCLWAGDERTPGFLDQRKYRRDALLKSTFHYQFHKLSTVKQSNMQLKMKCLILPHHQSIATRMTQVVVRTQMLWPTFRESIRPSQPGAGGSLGAISQVRNSKYRTPVIYRLRNPP